MKVTGIILAAGNSTRFGTGKNKNLFEINRKPVIQNSIETFNNSDKINDIILVIKEEEKLHFENIVNDIALRKPIKYIAGGASRKGSVYNALNNINSDFVVIHDGARPNIKLEYIDKLLKEMENYKGATIGVRSKDTIKICDENQVVISTTNRKNTWIIQTPQCFDTKILKSAHEKFDKDDESITDDCMVLEKCGYDVKIVSGDYSNLKVTTFDDINFINIEK